MALCTPQANRRADCIWHDHGGTRPWMSHRAAWPSHDSLTLTARYTATAHLMHTIQQGKCLSISTLYTQARKEVQLSGNHSKFDKTAKNHNDLKMRPLKSHLRDLAPKFSRRIHPFNLNEESQGFSAFLNLITKIKFDIYDRSLIDIDAGHSLSHIYIKFV